MSGLTFHVTVRKSSIKSILSVLVPQYFSKYTENIQNHAGRGPFIHPEKTLGIYDSRLVDRIAVTLIEHDYLSGKQDSDVRIAGIPLHEHQAVTPGKAPVQAVPQGKVTPLLRIGGIDKEQAAVLPIVRITDNGSVAAGIGQGRMRIGGPGAALVVRDVDVAAAALVDPAVVDSSAGTMGTSRRCHVRP